ncbi:MAG: hypothetical protein AAGI66_09490 [Cyanobacteria bacterium P01_H01_bin.74]
MLNTEIARFPTKGLPELKIFLGGTLRQDKIFLTGYSFFTLPGEPKDKEHRPDGQRLRKSCALSPNDPLGKRSVIVYQPDYNARPWLIYEIPTGNVSLQM